MNQARVAFLLPRNHLVDDHRATGGDGFLHHRPAGFGDHQVVRHQQPGHLVGPAIDTEPVAVLAEALGQSGLERGVAPDGDGQVQVGDLEQPIKGLAGLGFAGVDDIKHLAPVAVAGGDQATRAVPGQRRG